MPVDVRSMALVVLAALAGIFALQWARAILVPVLLGVMFSYALTPAVDRIARWHVPRALAAGALLSAIVLVIGWGAWALSDDASALIETLPQVAQKVRHGLEGQGRKPAAATIDKMQQAANELELAAQQADADAAASAASSAAAGASGAQERGRTRFGVGAATATAAASTPAPIAPSMPRTVTRVVVERPALNIRDYLWTGTLGLFAFLGQLAIVFFVTLFLLASGDTFRRKMVKLAGPRLSQKRITIQALDEVSAQIQRYLLVQLATSIVVGFATGLAFLRARSQQRARLGRRRRCDQPGSVCRRGGRRRRLGAGRLHPVRQHRQGAVVIGARGVAIHAVVGNLLTPWWTGRASRMSPFAVFLGVLTFGWLWGADRPDPRHADPDGREGGVRPGRRAEAGRRISRCLSGSRASEQASKRRGGEA